MNRQELLSKLSSFMQDVADIDSKLFTEYGVKRGLRNSDGSGVLVGLSKIGDAVGYEKTADGLKPMPGQLFYRGINIEDIVRGLEKDKRSGFEEVAYLLLSGNLPNAEELQVFRELLIDKMALSVKTKMSILNLEGTNIMNILARSVLVMYTMDSDPDSTSADNLMRQSIELIAKIPTIIAYAYNIYRHNTQGLPLHIRHPRKELSVVENFLYMLKREFTPLEARLLDLLMVLHAEHGGGNNSTFTVRVTSSSGTDTYSSIVAGINSLKGPLHGGANIQVADMFAHLKANISNWEDEQEIDNYLFKILNKEAYNRTGLIYGIGHAVYTVSDPRAELIRELARDLAQEKGREREFAFLERLEKRAQACFTKFKAGGKTVSSNVDFYSGFIYELMGLPQEIYTPLFAMSRIMGWVAHRNEELLFSGKRIIRPSYKNVATPQPYTSLASRQ